MEKKREISFFAYKRRAIGLLVAGMLFSAMVLGMVVVAAAGEIERDQLFPYLFCIAVIMVMSISLFYAAVVGFFEKIIITDDAIAVRGVRGEIARCEISEIDEIVYYKVKTKKEFFVWYHFLKVIKKADIDETSPSSHEERFIGFDCSRKRLEIVKQFWEGEITNLPKKYRT